MLSGTFSRSSTRHVVCLSHLVLDCRGCACWPGAPVRPAIVLPFPTNELPPRVSRAAVTQMFAGTFPERREAWARWG